MRSRHLTNDPAGAAALPARSWSPGWPAVIGVSVLAASVLAERDVTQYPAVEALAAAVIVAFAVAGLVLANEETQRRNGRLLIAVAVLQAIMHLHLVPHSPLPLVGWLAGPLSAMPLAVVLLRFPGERLDPLARRWAVFQTAWLVGSRLTFTVPTPERRLGWWPAIPMSPSVAAAASTVGNGVAALSTLFFAGLLLRRVATSRGMLKHEIAPVLVAAAGASIAIVLHLTSVATGRAGVDTLVLAVEEMGLLAVPCAFVWSAVRMRLARAAVGDLLLQLGHAPTPVDVEAALARTLADPALRLYLHQPQDGSWITAGGHPQEPFAGPDQVRTPILSANEHPLAVIVTDEGILRHRNLLDASLTAARLALQNASAIEEIQRSRARIAEAGLRERRLIERDLHDGAQQRLLALSMRLDQLRRRAADDSTRSLVEVAARELEETIREVRDFARGVHPAVLTQSGLAAAVVSAAERLPLPVDVAVPDGRWPATAEAAAYFVVFEALTNVVRHAEASRAGVVVTDEETHLRLEVTDDGHGGADSTLGSGLQGLVDRVSALGGTVEITSQEGSGTCIIAIIPCGSP